MDTNPWFQHWLIQDDRVGCEGPHRLSWIRCYEQPCAARDCFMGVSGWQRSSGRHEGESRKCPSSTQTTL